MVNIALPVSRVIEVDIVLDPALAQAPAFNSLLVLGTSTVIDTVERIREYGSLTEVGADFGGAAEEYLAAVRWFGQKPQPTSLQIGRWCKTAASGQLIGGGVTATNQLMATWNAINNGAALVYVDGVPYALTGLNFAAAVSMPGVAGIIQTALTALIANSTVVWSTTYDQFVVTSPSTGASSSVSVFSDPTAIGNITFAAQPAANATVTIGGTVVTFVAGAPVGSQVQIGASLAATLTALATFLNSSQDVNIVKASYSSSATKLYIVYQTPGAGGNAFTIAASVAVPSGATLAGGTGTTIAEIAALTQVLGAYSAPGVAAETALAAVELLDNEFSTAWYGLVIPSASSADDLAVAAYVDGVVGHFYGVTTMDPNVPIPTSTTDIAYLMQQQGNNHAMVQYSSTDPYAVVSALARILTTNWTGSATAITLKFKQEPGVVPEQLSVSQANAIEAKNCNVFVAYNNATTILEQGICPSGQFVDTVIGADWFGAFIQTNLYNVLYGSTTKIPQTDAGNHVLATSIESSCDQAVQNGLLGPGTWTATGFGQLQTDDYLPKGYYVYAPPIASQAPSDRSARKSVPFQVAAKLAGAIHSADVILNVNS